MLTVFDILRCVCTCRYGVSGFPTIKFFPKTDKDGESVSGCWYYITGDATSVH